MIDTAETIRKVLKSVDRKKHNSPHPPELYKRTTNLYPAGIPA